MCPQDFLDQRCIAGFWHDLEEIPGGRGKAHAEQESGNPRHAYPCPGDGPPQCMQRSGEFVRSGAAAPVIQQQGGSACTEGCHQDHQQWAGLTQRVHQRCCIQSCRSFLQDHLQAHAHYPYRAKYQRKQQQNSASKETVKEEPCNGMR